MVKWNREALTPRWNQLVCLINLNWCQMQFFYGQSKNTLNLFNFKITMDVRELYQRFFWVYELKFRYIFKMIQVFFWCGEFFKYEIIHDREKKHQIIGHIVRMSLQQRLRGIPLSQSKWLYLKPLEQVCLESYERNRIG